MADLSLADPRHVTGALHPLCREAALSELVSTVHPPSKAPMPRALQGLAHTAFASSDARSIARRIVNVASGEVTPTMRDGDSDG